MDYGYPQFCLPEKNILEGVCAMKIRLAERSHAGENSVVLRALFCLLVLLFGVSAAGRAQDGKGDIRGTVTDSIGVVQKY